MNRSEYIIKTTLQRDPELLAEVTVIKKHSLDKRDFGRWMYDWFVSHEKDVFGRLTQKNLEAIRWSSLFDLIFKGE